MPPAQPCTMIRLAMLAALWLPITQAGAQVFEVLFSSNLGRNPSGTLVQGGDGSFYGTTNIGGLSDDGTVYRMSGDGTVTTIWSFNGVNGRAPQAGLVAGGDGNFYGTTIEGGGG